MKFKRGDLVEDSDGDQGKFIKDDGTDYMPYKVRFFDSGSEKWIAKGDLKKVNKNKEELKRLGEEGEIEYSHVRANDSFLSNIFNVATILPFVAISSVFVLLSWWDTDPNCTVDCYNKGLSLWIGQNVFGIVIGGILLLELIFLLFILNLHRTRKENIFQYALKWKTVALGISLITTLIYMPLGYYVQKYPDKIGYSIGGLGALLILYLINVGIAYLIKRRKEQ